MQTKNNGLSLTDNELIGADQMTPPILLTLYFIRAQGHDVEENVMYQDNQSTMRLIFNGRASSTKRTRHLNVKLFHIKDVIARGDLSVEYCPTEEMWADVLTKPLQGRAYRVMRSKLMNCPVDYVDECNKKVWFADITGVGAATKNTKITGVQNKQQQQSKSEQKTLKQRKQGSPVQRRSVLGKSRLGAPSKNAHRRRTYDNKASRTIRSRDSVRKQ